MAKTKTKQSDQQKTKFYNQKQKEEYISSCPENRVQLLTRIFLNSKALEEQKGKDLCDFSSTEVMELYSYCNVSSPSVLRNMQSVICQYKNYMNTLTDDVALINMNVLRNRINKAAIRSRLITREELVRKIKYSEAMSVFNPSDAFSILAFFEGFGGDSAEELWKLKETDLYIDNGNFYAKLCTGRTIKISKELYEYAMQSAKLTHRYIRHRHGGVQAQELTGEPGDILKFNARRQSLEYEVDGEKYRFKRQSAIRNYIVHEIELAGLPTSLKGGKTLRTAGIMNMVNEGMEKYNIDADTYIQTHLNEVMEQYNIADPIYARVIIRDYSFCIG